MVYKDFHCITGKIKSCIISPLFQGERIVSGTLKIYFDKAENVTARNQYLAEGFSHIYSIRNKYCRKLQSYGKGCGTKSFTNTD